MRSKVTVRHENGAWQVFLDGELLPALASPTHEQARQFASQIRAQLRQKGRAA